MSVDALRGPWTPLDALGVVIFNLKASGKLWLALLVPHMHL